MNIVNLSKPKGLGVSLNVLVYTGVDLGKILGWQTKILGGGKVVKCDKRIGVSQFMWGTCPGCPLSLSLCLFISNFQLGLHEFDITAGVRSIDSLKKANTIGIIIIFFRSVSNMHRLVRDTNSLHMVMTL